MYLEILLNVVNCQRPEVSFFQLNAGYQSIRIFVH